MEKKHQVLITKKKANSNNKTKTKFWNENRKEGCVLKRKENKIKEKQVLKTKEKQFLKMNRGEKRSSENEKEIKPKTENRNKLGEKMF